MRVYVHDENSNEFLSKQYWTPLIVYANNHGLRMDRVQDTEGIHGSILLIHGDKLSPERIQRIKNNGNKLVIFDINDSSYMSSAYIGTPEMHLADLIFKVAGVMKENEGNEVNLDRNFQIQISREKYLPDEQWAEYVKLRPKIRPLPYVLWNSMTPESTPIVEQSQRNGKVLVRGGNHFWRVVLFFRLMQDGLLDRKSEFHTSAYFSPTMEKRFQYCDSCKAEKAQHGRCLYDAPMRRSECNNPATSWGLDGEFYGGPMFGRTEHGLYNNRCGHSFFWLAKQFEERRGPLDHSFLEDAFNGDMRPVTEFVRDLSHASYSGELKWRNTANVPPRFWEAAALGTPSLYPRRTSEQEYWPRMTEGEHYFAYDERLNDFELGTHGNWSEVSRAAKALYEENIRGTEYAISNRLLEYMTGAIREIL